MSARFVSAIMLITDVVHVPIYTTVRLECHWNEATNEHFKRYVESYYLLHFMISCLSILSHVKITLCFVNTSNSELFSRMTFVYIHTHLGTDNDYFYSDVTSV